MDEDLSRRVIGAAIEVHRHLGPGLLGSAYHACLVRELEVRGIPFEQHVELPVIYKGVAVDCLYRMDIVVAGALVLELKSVMQILAVHQAQVLTYLKLGGFGVGLLLNFQAALMKDGILRLVL
jgi:GxxExxY protein